jgi:DNA-binding MarR family transcriptional regulator
MRSTQFVVLAAIHAGDSPTLPRLARDLVLDRSALTRSLKPLMRMDLVRVKRPASARASRAELTEKGLRLLRSSVPLWQEAQERFVERLGSKRWEELLAHLPAVLRASDEG